MGSDKKKEWPKYMLHAETGEGKVFETAEDVSEGYVTRDEYEAEDAAPPPVQSLAKQHGLTKKHMQAVFKEHKIDHDPKAPIDALAKLYLESFEADEDDADDDDGDADDGDKE